MGSEEFFVGQLEIFMNQSFPLPDNLLPNPYYWAGNEPDILSPYLFDFTSRPDLTQKWSRHFLLEDFKAQPNGIPGNDDYGEMSSWAFFSWIGFYPIAGSSTYLLGSPVFPSVEISRDEGDIKIISKNCSLDNPYVQAYSINGNQMSTPYFDHSLIAQGAQIEFLMGPEPNNAWLSK